MIDERLIKIIEYNGAKRQVDKAIEEMGELQQALMKHRYDCTGFKNVWDELVDCFIVLNQLQYIYDLPEKKLLRRIEDKINRTLDRYNLN